MVGSFAVPKRDMALLPTFRITEIYAIAEVKGTGILESANLFLLGQYPLLFKPSFLVFKKGELNLIFFLRVARSCLNS